MKFENLKVHLYFIILNITTTFLLGANACVKLKQFEEAIIWCDKGLAVSFRRRIQNSQYNYYFLYF